MEEFRADASIPVRQGRLFVVKAGAVKTVWGDARDDAAIIDFSFPGQVIGLESLVEVPTVHVDFRASISMTAVCHVRFNAKTAKRVSRQFCERLSAELAARIRSTYRHRQITKAGAQIRVAHFLIKVIRPDAMQNIHGHYTVPNIARSDIASYLHMRTETLSRVLSEFRKKGWIRGPMHRIEVIDSGAIDMLAGT
ncbi:fumarate and nitrate reduction regulatory protein [mine drainage metagenome]|uniref:Fumarate and nitrate reduction regulatory protein n=1 Tax=mine drainage metagenome TaxID=410659 RepID=A0A1J5PZN1_9ZZZZ